MQRNRTNDTTQEATAGPAWVVAGGMNVDRMGVADGEISGADSWPGKIIESPGGVGRNIAENLARLGLSTRLLSATGCDRDGDWLIEQCARAGIETDAIIRHPELPTGRYLSVSDRHGNLVAAVADMSVLAVLDAGRMSELADTLRQAAGIVVEANLGADALARLFESTPGQRIYADAVSHDKSSRLKPWLSRLHTLKLNRHEAQAITGRDLEPEVQAQWLRGAGVGQVVLSLGAGGVVFAGDHGVTRHAAGAVEVVSDTGAGDALFAGFIAAEALGLAVHEKLAFAQACAAITLGGRAANHPELSVNRVRQWLDKQ